MRTNPNKELIELFRRVEGTKSVVRVSFEDGSLYELNILSIMHADEGGDVVANILHSIRSSQPWSGEAINFHLDDVVKVESDNECLFTRAVA